MPNKPEDQWARLMKPIRKLFVGFAGWAHSVMAMSQKATPDNLMTLFFFGDLVGLPIIKPYYALHRLPHLFPRLDGWKLSMMKKLDRKEWSFD
jgi:hypothetical protein